MDAKKIVQLKLSEIKPYENNPRINEEAIAKVANSIREFGFTQPIIIDKDNVIICGHTRRKAAILLELEKVPCIVADWLDDKQVKALRLADNKVGELTAWDFDALHIELEDLSDFDMTDFGFIGENNIDWASVDDIEESKYEEPNESNIVCPKCGYTAGKAFFQKEKK